MTDREVIQDLLAHFVELFGECVCGDGKTCTTCRARLHLANTPEDRVAALELEVKRNKEVAAGRAEIRAALQEIAITNAKNIAANKQAIEFESDSRNVLGDNQRQAEKREDTMRGKVKANEAAIAELHKAEAFGDREVLCGGKGARVKHGWDYAISLQRAIEYHAKGLLVPHQIGCACPHHASMLDASLERPAPKQPVDAVREDAHGGSSH